VIRFEDVDCQFDKTLVLRGFTLNLPEGETVALLGRSGSGKTTVLRLVNRLVAPSRGRIEILGRNSLNWTLPELRRSIGYVVQEGGLFPHLTAAENVSLLLRLTGREAARRTRDLLDLTGLPPGEFADRYPHQLSGGQRQRVGVARALALDPPVLLFDEPFGALDPLVRLEMQRQFAAIRDRLRKTVLFVTHDLTEAVRVGHRIVLLREGRVDCNVPASQFEQAASGEAQAFREAFWATKSFA
jgi:osmoprotectant transport system ATP-binding protein